MKAYAVVVGPRRKVLSVALNSWDARYQAATRLDYEKVCGLFGSHHAMDRVLREHKAKVVRVEFGFVPPKLEARADA